MKNRYRIRGIHKKTGRRAYMSYATHKGQTFFSFNEEPSSFKIVPEDKFIELQIMAQTNMTNVLWECENETLQRRANITSGNTFRAVQSSNRRTSV